MLGPHAWLGNVQASPTSSPGGDLEADGPGFLRREILRRVADERRPNLHDEEVGHPRWDDHHRAICDFDLFPIFWFF